MSNNLDSVKAVTYGLGLQNASEYGPTFLGIIKTLILAYVNLPSSTSSIFYSLCHAQCDLFDSVVREHQEKRLCMLGGAKKNLYDIYTTTDFFFFAPPPLPTPPPVGSLT